MKRHRKIISIGCFLVASFAALPAVSEASPLLSGYGGPGQGNQAILGSALVNGPGSGGGGGASGGGGADGTGAGSQIENGSSSTVAGTGATTSPTGATSSPGGARQLAPLRQARAGRREKPAAASSFYPASETLPAGQSTALGLSSEDLVLVILAACAVALIGAFVRRLTRPARHDGAGG